MHYFSGVVLVLSSIWLIYQISAKKLRERTREGSAPPVEKVTKGKDRSTSEDNAARSPVEVNSILSKPEDGRYLQQEKQALDIPAFVVSSDNTAEDGEKKPINGRATQLPEAGSPPSIATSATSRRDAKSVERLSDTTRLSVSSTTMLPPPPRLKPPTFSSPIQSRTVQQPLLAGSSLRPPPSSASTLRAPPTVKPMSLSASTLPANGKPSSRQVILSPGHSPLDWATLSRDSKASQVLRGHNATRLSIASTSSPHALLRVPPSTLRRFNGRKGKDAWSTYEGRVYNITPYLPFHPGGEAEILKGAGRASEKLFAEVHPWVNWEAMLGECCVGILVSEDDARSVKVDRDGNLASESRTENANPLDEMD